MVTDDYNPVESPTASSTNYPVEAHENRRVRRQREAKARRLGFKKVIGPEGETLWVRPLKVKP